MTDDDTVSPDHRRVETRGSQSSKVEVFEQERARLFGLAYRMLGSVADADDVIQEAWLRFESADEIANPPAFLTTVTTRLAIDSMRAAHRRREHYVGPWLPEPIWTEDDPAHLVELDESLTLGFLHVLDRLQPVERAVFLLHDVFANSFADIAEIVNRDEVNCRQIASRARRRIRQNRPPTQIEHQHRQALLDAFLGAALTGDEETFRSLLADDVTLISDGGRERRAARQPVVGPDRVTRFILNLAQRTPPDGSLEILQLNGESAVCILVDGTPVHVTVLEFDSDRISGIRSILSPTKLRALQRAFALAQGSDPDRASPAISTRRRLGMRESR